MEPVDLEATRKELAEKLGRKISDRDISAYILYPKVFMDYSESRKSYGDLSVLPTPVFFYGMEPGQEMSIDIDQGKTLVVRYLSTGEADEEGNRTVFFELNGQPRTVKVRDKSMATSASVHVKAEEGNPNHVAAPMPGMVASLGIQEGQAVKAGDLLLTIEAMKMETAINAERDGVVTRIITGVGTQVQAKDLMIELS